MRRRPSEAVTEGRRRPPDRPLGPSVRATVTGASGFVGVNLLRALLDLGVDVRAADLRPGDGLDGLDLEFVETDVLDRDSLHAAFADAEIVFHLAAVVTIVGDPSGHAWRVNVEGPRNAARAALESGVRRFVHVSSVHAFDLEACGPSLDELGPRALDRHLPLYDRSKHAGEQGVREAIAEGLDAVIVNPTGVIGPHDYRPSLMGETILQLLEGKVPVNVGGGFDFVDVRDLVAGLIAAMQRGRTGENYLLSGTRISLRELGRLVATAGGTRPPRLDVPLALVRPLGPLVLKLTRRAAAPIFTPDSLHALRFAPAVSRYKAAKELGYLVRPIHHTVADTVTWFKGRRARSGAERTRDVRP